jgi:hypothetical protein
MSNHAYMWFATHAKVGLIYLSLIQNVIEDLKD